MLLEIFNTLTPREASDALSPCLDIARWREAIVRARPFRSIDDLLEHAGSAADPLQTDELQKALSHHPRIGERAAGSTAEADFSRAEQAGVDPADSAIRDALLRGNRAYEEQFGRIFLIRAAGRTPSEILEQLKTRLRNSPEAEERIVAKQLREIALLRLEALIS